MWCRPVRMVYKTVALSLCGLSLAYAEPVSLSSAWQAARVHDPSFLAAVSEREAGQAERAIGRAGLLPQISGSIGRSRMSGHLDRPDANQNMVREDLSYTSKVDELSLQQTVFNWDTFAAYRQGHAKGDRALVVFDTQANENSERLINRYFQVLLTQQNVSLSKSNVDAAMQHVSIAQRQFDLGEGTVTAIHEAQARHDIAYARWLVAQDELVVARRELQEMIGRSPKQVYPLHADIQHVALEPADLATWLEWAMARNAQIRLTQQDLNVDALEIQRAFSGHLPSLALTADIRKTQSETISTRNEENSTRSFGYRVDVPIFSGGETHARVQQAQHYRDRSQHLVAAAQEEIAVEVTRQHQGVISGAAHIAALQKAVQSNELAVRAAERGYRGGTNSIREILDSQERLYQAQLDLTQSRLEYVMARLKLAAAADGLDGALIAETSQTFFADTAISVE